MIEEVVTFQNEDKCLHGIIHKSQSDELKNKTLVVFMHGWGGYRIGPHRLFVKCARTLCNQGYDCLRFDYSGRGYSKGKRTDSNMDTIFDDLEFVIASISNKKERYKKIVLLGICIGASISVQYILSGKKQIDGVVLLSPMQLTIKKKEIDRHAVNIYKSYLKKLFKINSWLKFINGNINFRHILGILSKPIEKRKKDSKNSCNPDKPLGVPNVKISSSSASSYKRYIGEVLLIQGEKDSDSISTGQQYNKLLRSFRIPSNEIIISNADHNFNSTKIEKEVIDIISKWIVKHVYK